MRLASIVLLSILLGGALGAGVACYRVYSRPYDPDKLVQLISADPLNNSDPNYNVPDASAPNLDLPEEIAAAEGNANNSSLDNPNIQSKYNFFTPNSGQQSDPKSEANSGLNSGLNSGQNQISDNKAQAGNASDLPRPHLEVERLHQFGVLQNGEVGEHKFVLKNTGNATLHVAVDETSCKCTAAELGDGRVLPGKSIDILVTWKTADYMGNYSQRVLVKTNDPDLPLVELEVHGKIVADARSLPSEAAFTAATYGQASQTQTNLFCYKNPPLKIKGYRFLDPDANSLIKIEWNALDQDIIEREADATGGYLLKMELSESAPLGPFQQVLVLETDSPLQPEIKIPIHGKVTGSLSIAGPGWNEDQKTWVLGILDRGSTASKSLWILDRSPKIARSSGIAESTSEKENPGVSFEIQETDPKWLQVELEKPLFLQDAGLVRTVIKATIPSDAPICDYWGHQPQQKARIILKTSSEEAKTLLIYLRFAVKNKE